MLSGPRALAVAVGAGVLFGAIWIALAAARPGVTFHLAPIIVAASVGVTHRLGTGRPGAGWEIATAPALGAAVGLGTLGILSAADLLDGPAFAPFDDPVAESLVGIALGVVVALAAVMWPARAAVDVD